MTAPTTDRTSRNRSLPKSPTGIEGLDELTRGGLPRGRPTLVCGSAGCGKTLLGIEFLVRGATQFDEPGVLMAFEETPEELTENVRSLGFDLDELVRQKKVSLDYVRIERSEIEETGEYDLEGLFVRLGYAIDSIGAKRVVLDTIEALFAGLSNTAILRAELRRLFRWLKDKGVTAIITGERGDGTLTRHGLEEYVSDCVIVLDHRITEQISTRRLRIVKYRGSRHGADECPFLIDDHGISVLPVTSLGLQHTASNERVSSGVAQLDAMLGGGGYYRGTSVLVSGTAGTGKTSLSAHFADAACRRNERVLYMAFEESSGQFVRNMRSIGIELEPWVQRGLLRFEASRPTLYGLEMHLATMHKQITEFEPHVVVIDPLTNFTSVGSTTEVKSMLVRLIDFLKSRQITTMFTSLTSAGDALEQSEVGVSSLMDTWLLLRDFEVGGERNRIMYILKSRGMAHSNQMREFLLTDHGIELREVYIGLEGVLTGSSRLAQESREQAAAVARSEEIAAKRRELERARHVSEARITAIRLEYQGQEDELRRAIAQDEAREQRLIQARRKMGQSRKADLEGSTGPSPVSSIEGEPA